MNFHQNTETSSPDSRSDQCAVIHWDEEEEEGAACPCEAPLRGTEWRSAQMLADKVRFIPKDRLP